MMNLNNKGQSLAIFILIIPMIIGIMALVVDVGNALVKKNEIDNVIEYVLNYGLETSEVFYTNEKEPNYNEEVINWKDNLEILLNYNLPSSTNKVILQEKKIIIRVNTYVDGIFSNILNINGFKIESEYHGYINDDLVIDKIK